MATHTITITNKIFTYGLAATTRWGEFNWGEANWGEGSFDIPKKIGKLVLSNVTPSSAVSKKTIKFITNDITPSSAILKKLRKIISSSLTLESKNEDIFKFTGNGYYYIFKRQTRDGVDKVVSPFTADTSPGTSYTASSGISTPYTEL